MELNGAKYIDALNSCRRTLYQALTILESIISTKVDFLEEGVKPPDIALTLAERYFLVQKFALAIRLLIEAYADNQRLRWAFFDMESRFAVLSLNILDMRAAIKHYMAMDSDYNQLSKMFALQKRLLLQSASNYRTRFEQSAGTEVESDDLRLSIQYMSALIRLASLINDPELADFKARLDLWESKRVKEAV
jgi:hypothetical protein